MIKRLNSLNRLRCYSQFKKLESNNYFDIFNIEDKFLIDQKQLTNKFKSMQMLYHPDKTAKFDQESRKIAEYNSYLINHAYQTLRDPYKRGIHLLNLNNLTVSEDESTKDLSNEFLGEAIEINEQINDNRLANDELKKILNNINIKKNELLIKIEKNFKDKIYLKAKNNLIKLNFYDNAIRKIIDLID